MTVPHWKRPGGEPLSWRLTDLTGVQLSLQNAWPGPHPEPEASRSTGRGVRVCVLDSGVAPDHPAVGPLAGAHTVTAAPDGQLRVEPDPVGDTCGHGTACAGIIRSLAPDCDLVSLRVLGSGFSGTGDALLAGLRWAVEQRFDVINMSLSTAKRDFVLRLHELADSAYFSGTVLVASAHNLRIESFPWRFSSVISVGSHDLPDPEHVIYNPVPPVEFFARGVDVPVAWLDGGTRQCTGNSFATPHVAGLCARLIGSHPGLTPFQVKSLLHLTAANVRSTR
ncbi:S8 family peptidase [Kitasatospora azatica]|uniref:S8 family peptidase n=1 Tax=Kitasatospora azatica TaxID=58347 RepID=UPI00055BA690|nr:S8 family serine peptidase [Kitasatospora azatica]